MKAGASVSAGVGSPISLAALGGPPWTRTTHADWHLIYSQASVQQLTVPIRYGRI